MKKIPEIVLEHDNLNLLEVYKFENLNYSFPNLSENHISEATYYRLFIEKYINKKIESIIYLDADTICINNPLEKFTSLTKTVIKSDFVFGARTEKIISDTKYQETFSRLNMTNKYFNAGVLVVDLKKWRKRSLSEKLLKKLDNIEDKIIHWDQDVLNSYIDGNYVEIDESLNFDSVNLNKKNIDLNEIEIIHYIGSNKPWYISGIFENGAKYYHQIYSKIATEKYHVVHLWKKASILEFIKGFLKFKFVQIESPYHLIKSFLKSF
jgi:lipopolysaccharide biosynthesis glycosyltransferase